MTTTKSSAEAELEIRELGMSDEPLLAEFDCGDEDLNEFLRDDARRLQEHHVVRPYVAFVSGRLAGYVALMADAVKLQTRERKRLRLLSQDHPIVPAVKVARIAVGKDFQRQGLGVMLMRYAVAEAYETGDHIGCRLITLDAYPAAVSFYERLGFVFNKAPDYRAKDHPSMRLDLYAPEVPTWLTGEEDESTA